MEIQVNVGNYLKILRDSTFNKDVFVGEVIQNAQRAKATKVEVSTYMTGDALNAIRILNNGEMLTDFSKLLSIADSGWNDEIKKSENPFGTGFWSVPAACSKVEVSCDGHNCTIDLNYIIETGDTTVQPHTYEIETEEDRMFCISMLEPCITYSELCSALREVAKFNYDLEITLDGEVVPTSDLFVDMPSHGIKIDTQYFRGWISLTDYFSNNIDVIHQGRPVTVLSDIWYAKGVLISSAALTLRAPDRKAFIETSEYHIAIREIRDALKEYATQCVIDGNIKEHLDAIKWYAEASKYALHLPYNILAPDKEEDFLVQFKDLYTRKKSTNLYENIISATVDAEVTDLQREEELLINQGKYTTGSYSSGSSSSGTYSTTLDIKNKSKVLSLEEEKLYVYISSKLENITPEMINIAKQLDASVIFYDNELQKKGLEHLSKTHRIYSLSKLLDSIKVKVKIDTLEVDKQKALFVQACIRLFVDSIEPKNKLKIVCGDVQIIRSVLDTEEISKEVAAYYFSDTLAVNIEGLWYPTESETINGIWFSDVKMPTCVNKDMAVFIHENIESLLNPLVKSLKGMTDAKIYKALCDIWYLV